ncbi:MFS transporter [Lacticaseibacillus yichunensis]|uniref:MFS transporter n=1 Tax=Lacticaseibacillus yichunensis TaxID=2486015 RepID=A0ABW4CNT8_9LACO|nr:MFS transporter [Lacticaseibacillus yichunensis]
MKEVTGRKWWVLVAVCLAVFMGMLDITIVNVALPEIQKSFATSFSTLQWVLNAYTLVYAMMLLPVSKLGDRFGKKQVFLIGVVIFMLGSLLSGLATNDTWLNIARGFQGIGGAAMMSLSLSIVTLAFPETQRGLALGIWSSVTGLAVSIGPLIGGALVDSLGWRAIFLINLPVAILTLIMGVVFIEKGHADADEHLDWLGMLFSILMVFGLILALIQKEMHMSYAWTDWRILSLFGLALVSLIAFIAVERHGQQPMIRLSIFRSAPFVGANIAAFTLGAGIYGGFTYLSILMQNYMNYSAFQTGLKLLWISVFTLVLGPLTGFLTNKIGSRWLISAALVFGTAGILTIDHQMQVPFAWSDLFLGFILLGISNALVNPPISTTAMGAVAKADVGMASGVLNVFRQVGISFGVVILGIAASNGYTAKLDGGLAKLATLPPVLQNPLPAAKGQLVDALHQAGAFAGEQIFASPQTKGFRGTQLFEDLHSLVFHAFENGFARACLVIAGLLAVGAVSAMVLIKPKAKEGEDHAH